MQQSRRISSRESEQKTRTKHVHFGCSICTIIVYNVDIAEVSFAPLAEPAQIVYGTNRIFIDSGNRH